MSAERELERASQEFWLAIGEVGERARQLAYGAHPDVHGYAYLVARAEKRYGLIEATSVGVEGVTIDDLEGKWVIVRSGDKWLANSERQAWSKDSRDWGTVYDDGTYSTFGQAYHAMTYQRSSEDDL